jgi:hypothetical protein
LFEQKVRIRAPRIKFGAANPAPKLATVVAGMCVVRTVSMTSTWFAGG